MAEGLFRQEAGHAYDVFSAGTRPSSVREEAIAAMSEIGIDISGHRSKSLSEFSGKSFDLVITVCDNAARECPVFSGGAEQLHWPFDDPAAINGSVERRTAAFRRVRDQIHTKIQNFAAGGA